MRGPLIQLQLFLVLTNPILEFHQQKHVFFVLLATTVHTRVKQIILGTFARKGIIAQQVHHLKQSNLVPLVVSRIEEVYTTH